MRHLKRFFPLMLMILSLALAGCGSSSSGSTPSDPLAPKFSGYSSSGNVVAISDSGAITFITSKSPTDPDGTLNRLTHTEAYDSPAVKVRFVQLITFKVTDSKGNPRIGVPVKLDVYSQSGSNAITINYLKDGVLEPTPNTVTTDSLGMGIFNITVDAPVPETPGITFVDGIVYKAVTYDSIPLKAYGGFVVESARAKSPPPALNSILISPTMVFFAKTDVVGATVQLTISGGLPPYTVTSSNPARVLATLQPDGVTVIATLKDASLWNGWETFSVIDANGLGALFTPYIWRY